MSLFCIVSVCTTQISVHHYNVAAQLYHLMNIRILSSIFNKINQGIIALNNAQKNDKICICNSNYSLLLCVQIACRSPNLSGYLFFIFSFQMVVQGFSPTANLSWISLQFYVLVSHSFHVVESVLSFATLSLFNDQFNYQSVHISARYLL